MNIILRLWWSLRRGNSVVPSRWQATNSSADPFSALDAIRYISYLTIGYMVARGLAKSGSREHYFDDSDARR
jgi:hypothetical protein